MFNTTKTILNVKGDGNMNENTIELAKILSTDDAFNLAFSSAKTDEEKFELAKTKINDLTRVDFSEFLEKLREVEKSSLSDLSVDELQMVSGGLNGSLATKLAATAMFVTALGATGVMSQRADAITWDESVALRVLDRTFNDGYVKQNPAAFGELTALHSEIDKKYSLSIDGDPASYFAQKLPSTANQDVRSRLVAAYNEPETVLPSRDRKGKSPLRCRTLACKEVLIRAISDYTRSAFLDYLIENVAKKADLDKLKKFIDNCYFPVPIKQQLDKMIAVDDDANLSLDDIAEANGERREGATGQDEKKVKFTICHQLLKFFATLDDWEYLTPGCVAKLKERLSTDRNTRQELHNLAANTIEEWTTSLKEQIPQLKHDDRERKVYTIDTAVGAVSYSSRTVKHIMIGDYDLFGCLNGGGHTKNTVSILNSINSKQHTSNSDIVPEAIPYDTHIDDQGCPVATIPRKYANREYKFFPEHWNFNDILDAAKNCIAKATKPTIKEKEKKIIYKYHPTSDVPSVKTGEKANINQVSVCVVIGCSASGGPPYHLVTCYPIPPEQEKKQQAPVTGRNSSADVTSSEISKSKEDSQASRSMPEASSLNDKASASSISTSQPDETQTAQEEQQTSKGFTIETEDFTAQDPKVPSLTKKEQYIKRKNARHKAKNKNNPAQIKNNQLPHRNKTAEQKQSPSQNGNDNQIANDALDTTITSGQEKSPATRNNFISSIWNYIKALWNYLKPW